MTFRDVPALRLHALAKRYRTERWVLRDLSLTVPAGERVALLGESGVGKSTLLNLIAGLERPDAGQIEVDGIAVHALDEPAAAALRRTRIGFVFQAFHLMPQLTLWQNVAIPLLLNHVPVQQSSERALELLERVGLGDRAESLPRELSGGEQQRVALARALVHRPLLVLADEPTGNLDPATAADVLGLMREQVRSSGASLLMATHSAQAAAIADRRLRLTATGLQDE
ncbi:MAG TPA: ABC transporter ATP-binding protein [Burkholderiaceae bacterium]|nr:ABC transporter ATP-binding protein [Burkholderiaceae bacterium]